MDPDDRECNFRPGDVVDHSIVSSSFFPGFMCQINNPNFVSYFYGKTVFLFPALLLRAKALLR